MNGEGSGPPEAGGSQPARPGPLRAVCSSLAAVIFEIRLAAGFLTLLPVAVDSDPALVARSLAWFPLVGLALGAVLALESLSLGALAGPGVNAVVVVMSAALLTGAVHLDGVADTADALGAGRDRERVLAVLRDSRVGVFGALGLFFVLALKVAALWGGAPLRRALALGLATTAGRWAMVAVSYRFPYLRTGGAGSALLAESGARNFVIASQTAAVAALASLFFWPRAALALVLVPAAVAALRRFYRRWLGGVTGDLIGAAGELVETLVLAALLG